MIAALVTIFIMLNPSTVSARAQDAAAAGKRLFASRCASCHGPNGEGREATARTFKVEMRHLASKEVQDRTDAELRKLLAEGGIKAKPVRNLRDGDITNLIAFLRTLKK
jgi:mono/diheme cytochrome c family protein